jgi:hypothetical protein
MTPKLLCGYNEELVDIMTSLVAQPVSSLSIYLRHVTASTTFDRQTEKWVRTLTEDGQAGVLLRVGGSRLFLVEVSDAKGGLWFQESIQGSLRFDIERFHIVRIIHGPIDLRIILDYIERVRHRLYSEDSATRPRDFAVDMFDWILGQGQFRVTDLSEKLVKAFAKDEYPPKTRAPNFNEL